MERAFRSVMRFSLIVATFGRTVELQRLLDSITAQRYRDMEVIVVDQNEDDRVLQIIKPYAEQLEIIHRRCEKGASRARNLGISIARGDVIGFPDDDCWYPDNVLRHAADFLSRAPEWGGIIGHTVDSVGKQTLPWGDRAGPLSPAMSWRRAVTYVYFLRRDVVLATGGFDITLGPGAGTPWGASDDNDFMLRSLKQGARVYFDPRLCIHHPPLFSGCNEASISKRKSYSRSDGRVLRKHPMPLWWTLAFFGVPLVRLLLTLPSFNRMRLRFHWVTLTGRVRGYRDALAISD